MIELTKNGDVWTVMINRPDKANSLTKDMLVHLADIARDATAAKVLIITGKGRVFSAGADLDQVKAGLATDPVWEQLSGAIAALPILTIAALNGTLAGGAFGMALACDVRIAVPSAKFFYPVMKLGFLPQPSDPARMVRLVGPSRSKLILMAGQRLTAQQAYEFGLIDRIVDAADFPDALQELSEIASLAKPDVATEIKRLIDQ